MDYFKAKRLLFLSPLAGRLRGEGTGAVSTNAVWRSPLTRGAARLYLCFRWMGDHEDWSRYAGLSASLRRLRRLGRELGVF